jgi:chemotaxis protein histidine kinase CheA
MSGTIPRSGKAYEIFVNEYHKHIAYITTVLNAETGIDAEEQQKLSRLFHTIKGGAGFFGFDVIHKSAGVLEKILKNPDLKFAAEKNEILSIFNELSSYSGEVKI